MLLLRFQLDKNLKSFRGNPLYGPEPNMQAYALASLEALKSKSLAAPSKWLPALQREHSEQKNENSILSNRKTIGR